MTKKELTSLLINARKGKNLSHEQVVLLMNNIITRQYYGMIENGERRPSVKVAKAIAKVLEVKWTIFFDTEGNHRLLEEQQKTTA